MLSLCSNVSAIKLQRQLNQNENSYAKAIERMTSGFKINSGADDAAGLIVATSLTSKLGGLDVVQGNIQGANAIMQIGQGSLENMSDMLLRIRDLALQSANGTNSLAQRVAMQGEVDSLLEEIIKQKNSAKFNDYSIFGTQTKLDKNKTYTNTNPIVRSTAKSTFSMPIGENSTEETVKNTPTKSRSTKEISTFSMNPTQTISFTGGESKNDVIINGKTYSFKNISGYSKNLEYSFDDVTGEIMFNGNAFEISTKAGETNNITLEGTQLTLNAQDNDTITTNSTYSIVNGGSNHIINGQSNTISGSDTNGNYTIAGQNNILNCGNGDNAITNNGSSASINGGIGSNIITNNSGDIKRISNINKFIDNVADGKYFQIGAGSTFELVYKGKSYLIEKNAASMDTGFEYSNIGDSVDFNTAQTTISTLDNTNYNIKVTGIANTINGNNTNSTFQLYGDYSTFNGGDGAEDITISGDNATINGNGGNNAILNMGNNNTIDGGSGSNTLNEYGRGSIISNIQKIIAEQRDGNFSIKNGESIEYILAGKSYTVSNSSGANQNFSFNLNGAQAQIWANNLAIATKNDTLYNFNITGDYNIINGNNTNSTFEIYGNSNKFTGGDGNETIKILGGRGNEILGGNGNDNITINSNNNTIYGGNGNDIFTINGSINTINGDNNDDIFNNYGTNNTFNGGAGNDIIYEGGNNSVENAIEKIVAINTNGTLSIANGQSIEYVLDGKSYTITNNSGADSTFSFNKNGNEMQINASNLQIATANGINYDLKITGNGNTVNGNDTNSTYKINGSNNTLNGGLGAENISVQGGSNNTIKGNGGNDTITNNGSANLIDGGGGTNNFNENGLNSTISNISKITASASNGNFLIKNGETIEYVLDGKSYKIANNSGADRTFNYAKNGAEMELTSSYLEISTANNVVYNLKITGGNNTINGNDKNSTYKINGYTNTFNGGDGAENVTVTSGEWNVINGNKGNDNITVNTKNTTVLGGDGNNSYTFNGDNNRVTGGAGNDTLYNYGTNNEFSGGSGYDVLDEYGSGTIQSGLEKIIARAQSGTISIKNGQSLECVLGGKSYIIGNNSGADATFNYSQNGGEMELVASNFSISTIGGTNYDLKITGAGNTINGNDTNSTYKINGNNNTLNGGAGNENITIQNGSNNTINGNGGNDNITINSANNTASGGDGDDNFTINGASNSIFGNEGADYFLNNAENTTIDGGGGFNTSYEVKDSQSLNNINRIITDKTSGEFELGAGVIREYVIAGKLYSMMNYGANTAKFSFEEAMGEIKFNCNNFNITGSGNQIMDIKLYRNNNTITGSNASNSYEIFGNNNEVQTGSGNNLVRITGNNNLALGGDGDDFFEIIEGDGNEAIGGNGYDTIINDGTNSTYSRMDELQKITPPIYFQTGTTANSEESSVMVDIGFSLPIRKINITDYSSAIKAVNTVDGILSTLNDKLIKIGNAGVQLNSSFERNLTEETNLSASRSRIQDADIARESAELAKRQILKQSGSTLLNMCSRQNGDIIKSILLSSMK